MKRTPIKTSIRWNFVLVAAVLLSAFIIPVFPPEWGKTPSRLGFTLLFVSGVLSMEKKNNYLLVISFTALILEWISGLFEWEILADFSHLVNVIFFLIVVFYLIRQIATAKIVTMSVILESISGYLLLGIIYAVVISSILQRDPGAFNISHEEHLTQGPVRYLSTSMYFSFVSLSTVGFGDIVPLKPYARSLTTFICISGQLYIAIIIALLVGKFASGGKN